MAPIKIGVLLSGTGRTLLNLLAEIEAQTLNATIVCVISDRVGVKGLDHANAASIASFVETDNEQIFATLRKQGCDLVCLCGYLRLLPVAKDFENRVLNIHPSLLPKFGGKGFFGHHVHEAVIAAKEKESGCTVHYCNDHYDEGAVILQERIPVLPDDTPDRLAGRVFDAECRAYPEAIRRWMTTNVDESAGPESRFT